MSELRLEQVGLTVGHARLLDRIDFAPRPGALTAIIGPNGAGKTSLIRVASGYVRPTAGRVLLNGDDLAHADGPHRATSIGWLTQGAPTPWSMSVEALVRLGLRGPPSDAAVKRALERTGLALLRNVRGDRLSGGERQRLQIARAMCRPTPILLADEPVEALDPAWQLVTMEWLVERARAGAAVVAVLHDLNLAARFADRVVAMANGRIVDAGAPDAVLTPETLADLYGIVARVELVGRRLLISAEAVRPGPAGRASAGSSR